MMSSAASLWNLFRDQGERSSGIGLKLFGIIPESRSPSPGFLNQRSNLTGRIRETHFRLVPYGNG